MHARERSSGTHSDMAALSPMMMRAGFSAGRAFWSASAVSRGHTSSSWSFGRKVGTCTAVAFGTALGLSSQLKLAEAQQSILQLLEEINSRLDAIDTATNPSYLEQAVAGKPGLPNTLWISVKGSGSSECDGLYCPSTAAPKVSESGTKSEVRPFGECMKAHCHDTSAANSGAYLHMSCCCEQCTARRLCLLCVHWFVSGARLNSYPSCTLPVDLLLWALRGWAHSSDTGTGRWPGTVRTA